MNGYRSVNNIDIQTFLFASSCRILHGIPEQSIPKCITSRMSKIVVSCPSSPENHTLNPLLAPLYSATVDCFYFALDTFGLPHQSEHTVGPGQSHLDFDSRAEAARVIIGWPGDVVIISANTMIPFDFRKVRVAEVQPACESAPLMCSGWRLLTGSYPPLSRDRARERIQGC